ncbi:DsbA family protein [Rhodoligotrophos ferricapiens]|uniref:DsbA family protein n=1 Tax=Rhodoligotrophos ferricapiens TaxID=3069264 RepID=UPI00315CC977
MKTDRRSVIIGSALAGVALFAGGTLSAIMDVADARADPSPEALAQAGPLGDVVLGSDQAPVTIVEYASLTCPHCAAFATETFPQLKEKYIDTGKVKFIFREMPFDDLALAAAMVARCVPKDKFIPMVEMLFEQQKQWANQNARQELFNIAKLSGMTQTQFDECLKNEEIAKGLIDTSQRATKEFGVDSTPTFFVNGKILKGNRPLADFEALIKEAAPT